MVDDESLTAAVAAASDAGTASGIGALLVELGAVDSELIRQAATEQTMDSVFDLLRWPEGDFAFGVDANNPEDVGIRLTPESVVAEAAQRQGAWELIAAVIPGPDTVLTMPVVLAAEPLVTKDEWALLALVDGRRRVGDLVELTGCGQFAVVSSLSSLVDRGLLQVKGEHDHVTTVTRRQALLEPLERRTSGPETSTSEPVARTDDTSPVAPDEAVEQVEPAAGQEPAEDFEPRGPKDAKKAEPSDEADGAQEAAEPPTTPKVAEASESAEASETTESAQPASTGGASADVQSAAAPAARPESDRVGQPAARAAEGRRMGDVVPPRPEPFRPARRPDHPEPAVPPRLQGVPSTPQTSGAAAIATDPTASTLIERDPSVNRSLLLRLIAGVRGL